MGTACNGVALFPTESEAQSFVADAIQSYLNRFAHRDAEAIVAEGYAGESGGSEFIAFKDGLKTLGVLQFLDAKAAESITFKSLAVRNHVVRNTLGLVAARRWPQRLMGLESVGFEEKDYIRLLAVAAAFHPEFNDTLSQRSPKAGLTDARKRFKDLSLEGLFFLAGWASTGF